jgi:predicted nuclease with TOPRIM domain
MAKIEMDISEFKAMEENKKLLENALEREKKLNEQIDVLNKEKIKALEDAKMKVIKVTKEERAEHILTRKSPEEIYRLLQRININSTPNHRAHSMPITGYLHHIDYRMDTCFEKTTSYVTPFEEYTTEGLDEVKAELRVDIEKNIDDKIKDKLKKAEELCDVNDKLQKDSKKLKKEIKGLSDENTFLNDKIKIFEEDYKEISEKYDRNEKSHKLILKIKTFINGRGRRKIINKIKELLDE